MANKPCFFWGGGTLAGGGRLTIAILLGFFSRGEPTPWEKKKRKTPKLQAAIKPMVTVPREGPHDNCKEVRPVPGEILLRGVINEHQKTQSR